MENDKFGTIFVNGKILNLDSASIDEIEKYIQDVEKLQSVVSNRTNELYLEIKNN